MQSNPKFNLYFVSVVKKHEVLYNHKVEGYANKECVKAAWQKVAEDVKASEQECKDRWRCLRVSFLRTLRYTQPINVRGQDNSHRKTYYLTDALSFLLPFVKPKYAPLGFEARCPIKTEPDYEIEEEGLDSVSTEDQPELFAPDLLDEADHSNPSSITSARVPEYYTETTQRCSPSQELYFAPSDGLKQPAQHGSNRKRLRVERIYEFDHERPGSSKHDEDGDGDELFLKSLLPDMRKLTDRQKRRFKQRVLGLFDAIIEEDVAS